MKVLFLDCDGVLNDHRDMEVQGENTSLLFVNHRKVERLKEIIKETKCKVVLSSVWRITRGGKEFLESLGIPIDDVTPHLGKMRGHDIQAYLDSNPEIDGYVILDDDGDMLDSQLKHLVQTDPEVGLTDTMAYRTIQKMKMEYVHL